MSGQARQPSAVTLSAQNLAFASQGFVGGGPDAQVGNPTRFPAPRGGQQYVYAGTPAAADMERQAQKMREYEQQRAKLQQMNARGTAAANPDAMIAQMLGKPLAPNTLATSALGNRRPAPTGSSSFMYAGQPTYPTSAPPYIGAVPGLETRHSVPSNRPPMPPFVLSETGSALPPSAVHLTPKDLEKMMHHFAGIRLENGKFPTSATGELSHQGFKPTTGVEGVFVIPTMSTMMSPDGHQLGAAMGSPTFFMPPWTRDKTKLPEEYLRYLNACLPPSRPYGVDLPDTGLVYVLLRTSGLSNEILGTIWALTNRLQPGQLLKEEFFVALALVALAQENGTVASLEVLSSMQRPPVPRLSLSALNIPSVPGPFSDPLASAPTVSSPVSQSTHASIGRRLFNGIIEPVTPSVGVPSPAAPFQASSSAAAAAADDFGEFTDFKASAAVTPVTPLATLSKTMSNPLDSSASTRNEDPYEALRALAPSDDSSRAQAAQETDCQSAAPSSTLPSFAPLDVAKPAATKAQDDSFAYFTTTAPSAGLADHGVSRAINEEDLSSPAAISTCGAMARSRTDPKIASGFAVDMASVQKKDLNELLRQTCASLDLGGGGGCAKSDDDTASVRSESKEPSVHSLDLHSIKHFDLEQPESGDTESIRSQTTENHVMRSPAGSISLVDRYAAFRENGEHNGESATVEKHVDAWTKCLEACLQLLKQAESVFSKAEDEGVRKEILATDRGVRYLCGNVQIYRVSRRIRLSVQTMAFQTDKLIDLFTDIDTAWTHLCSHVAFSGILPAPENLDFREAVVPLSGPADERRKIACCGVCLLNVDATCKTDRGTSFDYKLTYGGRQYHAQCANLWINCIDSVLPALDFPCLL